MLKWSSIFTVILPLVTPDTGKDRSAEIQRVLRLHVLICLLQNYGVWKANKNAAEPSAAVWFNYILQPPNMQTCLVRYWIKALPLLLCSAASSTIIISNVCVCASILLFQSIIITDTHTHAHTIIISTRTKNTEAHTLKLITQAKVIRWAREGSSFQYTGGILIHKLPCVFCCLALCWSL